MKRFNGQPTYNEAVHNQLMRDDESRGAKSMFMWVLGLTSKNPQGFDCLASGAVVS